LIVSCLTKPPKIRVFSANGPVADFRANFQHIDCPHS
jgi:PKD repeat protein